MATEIPEIKGYVQGEYGKTIRLTAKDEDGEAQNLSSFDGTKTLYARHKKSGKEVSASISFTTDGTDGQFEWSFASGDINRAGDWTVQAVFEDTGQNKKGKTVPQNMPVSETMEG